MYRYRTSIGQDLRTYLRRTLALTLQTISSVKAISKSDLFRLLPSVDELLRNPTLEALAQREGRSATVEATRAALEQLAQPTSRRATLDEAQIKSQAR